MMDSGHLDHYRGMTAATWSDLYRGYVGVVLFDAYCRRISRDCRMYWTA
jgi:hypothetical protein